MTRQDCQPRDLTGQLEHLPLIRPGKLWPRLKQAISRQVEGRRLDLPRLLRTLARGRPLARLPRLKQARMAGEIVVVVDNDRHLTPYRQDWQQIVNHLARLAGPGALTVWTVRGDPEHPVGHWRQGRETPRPDAIAAPPRGAAVLLLSDLGALRHPAGVAAAMARWASFEPRGARCIACLPMTPALSPPRPAEAMLPLLDRAGRRPVCGSHPGFHPGAHSLAATQLERLLTLLSCARRIEPELLRAIRLLDPALAGEPGLEALVWSHPTAIDADEALCLWKPASAAAYRQHFRRLPAALQLAVFDALMHLHRVRGRSIEAQEILAWASHVDPATARQRQQEIAAAEGWWQAFRHDADTTPDNPELLAFARQTLAAQAADQVFVEDQAEIIGPVWAIAQAEAWRQGRPLEVPDGLPAARLGEWLSRHGALSRPADYHLAQSTDRLLLLPAATGQSRLGMPLRLAEIEVQEARGPRRYLRPDGQPRELARLAPGQRTTLATPGLRHSVSQLPRPAWAQEFGRDGYGAYADLEIAGLTQRLRWIEPGEFWMGSPDDEAKRGDDEGPRHRVLLTQGYWLSDSACTQALWQALMGANPSYFKEGEEAPQRPVENVSWDDVQDFLARLQAGLPGAVATLPTEAEWEYACRAGTETPFSFGADITTEQANYDGNFPYAGGEKGQYRQTTVPVKSLPANPWGLYEMHGNVFEWCADDKRRYGDRSETDPEGGAGEGVARRVVRGGSWDFLAGWARSADRDAFRRDFRADDLGFRFALRSPEPGLGAEPVGWVERERNPSSARSAGPGKGKARK
ncbi:MAG: formylglycine-generating enzyme family protein [Methyloversatilis sp.]|uniref:formylglycine-generating enzyme family protein n=1 Tax=Methyloversatilis sp. TaxID=2569862 RepID=UPI0027351140|nr:formylglycine-generating enzyme family protein [Methyloversatilis sp.]MDP2867440.1 formylglycine-generating enzyme family protein [Methyloversatilis sp.]